MEGKFRLISENGIIIFGEKLFSIEIVQEQTLEESSGQIYRIRKENQESSSGKFKTQEKKVLVTPNDMFHFAVLFHYLILTFQKSENSK